MVVAALAGGGVAWARSGGSPGYRTAAVTRGAVTASTTLAGTVTPLQSASVGFAQSGTVASVEVAVGQTVTAGQPLAALDLTPLRAKLSQAEATEATARLTLTAAEDGQLPAGSGSGSGGSGSGGGSSAGSSTSRSGGSMSTAALTSAQQAVQSAQQAVAQAQDAARSALAGATAACGGGTGGGGTSSADCLGAETAAMQAENDLSTRQSALAGAQTSLSQQLTTASTPAASSSTTTVSASQLAEYQAALAADIAAVQVAQQNLGQGTAVSPLSGTVVSVGVTQGQSVSAASSTQVIRVISPNGYEVDATVPTTDIASVKVGQKASVLADGSSGSLAASLTSISPTATTSGFAVTFGLSGTDATLRAGTSATVTLTTGSASDAVVVPTSAVHAVGTRSLVEVLDGSTVQPALVTLGVRGPLRTQVLSGLTVGQQVVLADLSSTVTSDSSTTTGGRTGLGGAAGFAGGGRFAGGGAGLAGRRGGG